MIEQLLPLKLPPGVSNNGTQYQEKGRWTAANLVRFFQGTIRPVGGWEARELTGDTILGTPTMALGWTPEVVGVEQSAILAIGTTVGLYVVVNDEVVDITPELIGLAGEDTGSVWHFDVFGNYLMALRQNPSDYTRTRGPFVWTGDVEGIAEPIVASDGAVPTQAMSLITTAERFFVLLGGFDFSGGFSLHGDNVPSQRIVYWATQEGFEDWNYTSTENTAGNYPLATFGGLLCGARTRGGTLLFTSSDVHLMRYIGGAFIHSFEQVGMDCGPMSSRAVAVNDTGVFWMGNSGKFFVFDGYTKTLPCEVQDYVFDNLNKEFAHTVWALSNPKFNEVTWFYPTGDSETPNAYVTFSVTEGHWTPGVLGRCAGVSSLPGDTLAPVMIDAAGVVYDHETGNENRSGGYLESGPIELGDGDQVMKVQRVVPDDKTQGDVNMTIYSSYYPDASETAHGPYPLASPTSVRLSGRQARVRINEVIGNDWRVGTIRLGVIAGGRR